MVLPFGLNTAKDWFHKTLAKSLVTSPSNSGTEDQPGTQTSFVNSKPAVSNNEFQTLTPIIDPDKEGYKPYFRRWIMLSAGMTSRTSPLLAPTVRVRAQLFCHISK